VTQLLRLLSACLIVIFISSWRETQNVEDFDESPAQALKSLGEMAEGLYPSMWRAAYPRQYEAWKESSCYYSPKFPAYQAARVTLEVMENRISRATLHEYQVFAELSRFRFPMYWLGKDMATAIGKTVPPGELAWYSMPLPHSAAVFMLPKGALVHPTEGDVCWIAYARLKKDELMYSHLIKGHQFGSATGDLVILAETATPRHLYHFDMPTTLYHDSVRLPDLELIAELHNKDSADHPNRRLLRMPLHMSPEDNHMMIQVVHYCFNSILLLNDRRDLVTEGGMLRAVTQAGERREYWSPNIIGQHYRIRRDGEGTHASPRFHWVRGFYRAQPYGPGFSLRRQMWVEPYTRGLGES
jgi:hypothetical protein